MPFWGGAQGKKEGHGTMIDLITSFSMAQWLVFAVSAFLIGLTKAGLDGGALIAVPLMAAAFGGRYSSGLLLGVLMAADLPAIWNYRHDPSLPHLRRTLPWAVIGIGIGAVVGGSIPDKAFRIVMGSLIVVSAIIMAYREIADRRPMAGADWRVSVPLGMLAGFASMVGNAAGSIMGLFLLSSGLGKGNIIGTSVWFFFLLNLVKLPFHLFIWHTVSLPTLGADLLMIPLAIASTYLGIGLVRYIPEKPYRIFLVCAAAGGGLYLLLR